MSRTYYTKETIDNYCLYTPIKVVIYDDNYWFNEREINGYLIPYGNKEYKLLPLDYKVGDLVLKRSHIKRITHLTNGYTIPKKEVLADE